MIRKAFVKFSNTSLVGRASTLLVISLKVLNELIKTKNKGYRYPTAMMLSTTVAREDARDLRFFILPPPFA
jgi:hypothetical protein